MANEKVKRKRVKLTYQGEPGLDIIVTGSFNQWEINHPKKIKLLKENPEKPGHYEITMFLPAGLHEYKFFSGKQWFADPLAEEQRLNEHGTFNSIIEVG